jgi:hypothetical protein
MWRGVAESDALKFAAGPPCPVVGVELGSATGRRGAGLVGFADGMAAVARLTPEQITEARRLTRNGRHEKYQRGFGKIPIERTG